MIYYSILSLSAFLISLLGTRLVLLALRKRTVLIDIPNLRSNHKLPVPKGGGLAVVMALVICLSVAEIPYYIILSLLLLTAISLLDDLIGVPVLVRFFVQALAVAVPLSIYSTPVFGGFFPAWLDTIVVGIIWLWFINLFNFMDGIDGLSATEMISIGLGLCFPAVLAGAFPDKLSIYSLIAASAGFGFLWWNWHPARIFLGDVGSVPIGFLLGYLLLIAIQSGYAYTAVILPAYYLLDATLTLLQRLSRGEKPWVAHSEHYYQKAVRNGRSHGAVVRYIFGTNLLLILLATMSMIDPELGLMYVAMAYFAVSMVLGFFAFSHPSKSHEPA